MKTTIWAAVAAALSLPIGAQAAVFDDELVLTMGTSKTFSYTFGSDFSGAAAISASGWYEYSTPDGEFGLYADFERDNLLTACGLTTACEAFAHSAYSGGGYLHLVIIPTAHGFDLLAENRLRTVDDCAGLTRRLTCGSLFGVAGLSISGVTEGGYEVAVQDNAVPEPAAWALMISGFGLVGAGLRARRRELTAT